MHVRTAAALPLFALFAVPFALVTGGCKASADASTLNNPQPTPTYVPPAPTDTGAPPPVAPTAPVATSTGPAVAIAPMAAAVVAPILTQMGQSEAPGAQPDGSPFAGQFAAGQTLEQVINIRGNGCYTVVGASIGITQLDITLVIQPTPLVQPITVAQSSPSGANATLGGKATGCWRNPTPLQGQGKVIMRATSGQGLAAAQVFVK